MPTAPIQSGPERASGPLAGGFALRRAGNGLGMAMLGLWLLMAVATIWWLNRPGATGAALHTEFSVFWGAAKLTLAGDWAGPFDAAALTAARESDPALSPGMMTWHYPPHLQIVVAPLGLLPFSAAWMVFTLVSLGVYAAVMRLAASGVPGLLGFAVGAPAVAVGLGLGHVTLLTAALAVGIWEALRRENWMLAGLLAALLTIKPQLGVLLPVALAALGAWRVFLWGALFFLLIAAATLVYPGPGLWHAFFRATAEAAGLMRAGAHREAIMTSWYACLVVLGTARDTALAAQIGVTLALAATVVAVMRSRAGFDLKAAVFLLAMPLATPYAYHYELILAAAGALYMVRGGFGSGRSLVLPGLLWVLPVTGIALLPEPGFVLGAPVLTLALGAAALRALGSGGTA